MSHIVSESALVIVVPEIESLVQPFRQQYDPSAKDGIAAHITVLYPFKPPDELTPSVCARLMNLFSQVPPFTFELRRTARFPGVLYLAPDPPQPFIRLTQQVAAEFPETPPYENQFDSIVPHLTIARLENEKELDRVAEEFERESRGRLPVQATAREVTLITLTHAHWELHASFAWLTSRGP